MNRSADRSLRLRREQLARVARDHQLFVGRNDPRRNAARVGADPYCITRVRVTVQLDADPRCVAADTFAKRVAVLSDSRGEDDGVQTAERGGERPELAAYSVDIKVDRRLGVRVVAFLKRSHIARNARYAK